MSRLALLAFLLAAPAVRAQAPAEAAAHVLPFASGGHTLELALGGDHAKTGGPMTVAVASAPAWLAFDQTQAAASPADEASEPVARLTFAAERTAPVGVPAEVTLVVRDASGAVVGEKTVRVVVSAPAALAVEAPRPNPSRGAVTVPYLTPAAGRVRVVVVDLLGREVAVLVDAEEPAGAHEARLPAGRLAAGVYAVRVTAAGPGGAGDATRTARLTVVR